MVRRSRRKTILISAGLATAFALAAGYLVWWQIMAGTMKNELTAWVAGAKSQGWTVDTGGSEVGGFPLAVELRLSAPVIADAGGRIWRGPPLAITARPWAPHRLRLGLAGRHQLILGDGEPLAITVGAAEVGVLLGGHGLEDLRLTAEDLTAGDAHVGRAEVELRRLAFAPVGYGTASLALTVQLTAIDLPGDPPLPLGRRLGSAGLSGRLLGWLPAGPVKTSVEAWRADGGTLEVDGLSVDWSPLKLNGKGTVALDRELQPILASSCSIRGLSAAVDALAARGVIRAKDGAVAKLVLGLLSRPAADGVAELTAPVSVENRTVYVGPAALFKLPELSWP